MADDQLRESERTWRTTGATADLLHFVNELQRSGDLPGEAARLALHACRIRDGDDLRAELEGVAQWGATPSALVAALCLRWASELLPGSCSAEKKRRLKKTASLALLAAEGRAQELNEADWPLLGAQLFLYSGALADGRVVPDVGPHQTALWAKALGIIYQLRKCNWAPAQMTEGLGSLALAAR